VFGVQVHNDDDPHLCQRTKSTLSIAVPTLLKLVCSGKLHPSKVVTHRFVMNDVMKAYDVFGNPA